MTGTREDTIREYKKLRQEIGRTPSAKTFFRESAVSARAAERAFGSSAFSKIQRAAGEEPRQFGIPGRSPVEFFAQYGSVVRNLGKIPSAADWIHLEISPHPDSSKKRLGLRWREIPAAFQEWAIDKPE